jgi:hypothetical protein
LKNLSLLKDPNQDVEIFGGLVVELCRRITGTGMAPADLVVLAEATFLSSNMLSFKLKAIAIHDMVSSSLGLCTPPTTGQAQVKMVVNGVSHSWCTICHHWMTGDKEQTTSKHIQGKDCTTDDPPSQPTPVTEPVVAALVAPNGVPYNGGGLHLHGGIFIAQLSEVTSPNTSTNLLLATSSTICRDACFHVTPSVQGQMKSGVPQVNSTF